MAFTVSLCVDVMSQEIEALDEMIKLQLFNEARSADLAIIISYTTSGTWVRHERGTYPTSASRIIVLLKTLRKYRN